MTTRKTRSCIAIACAVLAASGQHAMAVPTLVTHVDVSPHCDPLFIPTFVDEIGDAALFPPDEALLHSDQGTFSAACPPVDDPSMLNFLVAITNVSGRDFGEVWYVADPETDISNFDGLANDIGGAGLHEAFRIDTIGVHRALVSESILADNIWQAGEVWEFILQDYVNTNLYPPDAINSIGVGDASSDVAGVVGSSGSIIATPIPEPGSLLLAALGFLSVSACWRRRQ